MALKYKVVSVNYPSAEIYIEAHKVTELLSFQDYLKEINDTVTSKQGVHENGTKWYVFHPERNYDLINKRFAAYRIETGEVRLVDRKYTVSVGDYLRYDGQTDNMAPWDVEVAKQKPNLILVES